jgi:hypothetical protein
VQIYLGPQMIVCSVADKNETGTLPDLPIEGAAAGRPSGGALIDVRAALPMSALQRITDSSRTSRQVRKVPEADTLGTALKFTSALDTGRPCTYDPQLGLTQLQLLY